MWSTNMRIILLLLSLVSSKSSGENCTTPHSNTHTHETEKVGPSLVYMGHGHWLKCCGSICFSQWRWTETLPRTNRSRTVNGRIGLNYLVCSWIQSGESDQEYGYPNLHNEDQKDPSLLDKKSTLLKWSCEPRNFSWRSDT